MDAEHTSHSETVLGSAHSEEEEEPSTRSRRPRSRRSLRCRRRQTDLARENTDTGFAQVTVGELLEGVGVEGCGGYTGSSETCCGEVGDVW